MADIEKYLSEKIHSIYPKIECENCTLYIKDYYSNGYVVKFTLTDKVNEAMTFSGEKRMERPNYTPLFTIRDIFKNINELKYLGYKKIMCVNVIGEYEITDIISKDFGTTAAFKRFLRHDVVKCPKTNSKYKGIKGKKIIVTDNINNKIIETKYL